jgi:hypothetical protein
MILTCRDIERVELEVPGDLEQMAAKLLRSARKLPRGPERQNIVKKITSFRVRIAALSAKTKTIEPPQ